MNSTDSPDPPRDTERFQFARDTFAYSNELLWAYQFDPATGRTSTRWTRPRPTYTHRCFVMVRTVRQFRDHARFDSRPPPPGPEEALRLVRQVLRRNPRRVSAESDRVRIPGFAGFRAFSAAHEAVLKAECGGRWRSYFVRGHWRMVFPLTRRHQERQATALERGVANGRTPILHVVRFPQLTMNHALLAFAAVAGAAEIRFAVYDPNDASGPFELTYDRARRTFFFPRNLYWGGGRVDVYETYRNWLY